MALQAPPQPVQSPIPADAFAVDAPVSRRHYTQQSPKLGDQPQQRSPSSSRRPSRRPSGNGSQPTTPHQASHRSPNTIHTSSSSTARALPPAQPSPRTPSATNSTTQNSRRDQAVDPDRQDGPPISPPIRTSSNQRIPNQVPLVDRTRYRDEGQAGHRIDESATQRDGQASTPASAARSRKAVPTSPDAVQQSPNSYDPRAQQMPAGSQSRSAASPQRRPVEPPRENSEVINRLVVTDPEVDIGRERERVAEATPLGRQGKEAAMASSVPDPSDDKVNRRSRQDFSQSASKRKETKFGEYQLGQTLGEGEFGKVKLGWKKKENDAMNVQVAIKLIRRENLNAHPSRINKIYREVHILGSLSHPNIVRLHEMVETERYIGIILEYASGGELFDFILTHRYLKDNNARKLFAQLVSGVGYLHKKGIVHRDLKLENLLLDRNRNIIITDFGFANNFDPTDELGEEIEYNLTSKDYVKKMDLERVRNGFRRGDLMQTSCGSPCYAAPELVVTDSLYTGRKVDVWSCGVILYAMLAGYLPFDDDPANPEGDNINLLYKYIVSTPLTFPEYVTPHARDLLRRILIPDPRKRADLFEVARHSWLSEYAHVVAHITSSTTTIGEISNSSIHRGELPMLGHKLPPPAHSGTDTCKDVIDAPLLARSASVREPTKPYTTSVATVGALNHQGKLDTETENARAPRNTNRRTVQVEYVAPQSQTARGEISPPVASKGPPVPDMNARTPSTQDTGMDPRKVGAASVRKPLPQDPPNAEYARQTVASGRSSQRQPLVQQGMPPPTRPSREPPRSVSDSTGAFAQPASSSIARPNTGGSMSSTSGGRLPSRGNSYSQPLAPTVAATNAQGRLAQPKGARGYNISAPIPQPEPFIPDTPSGRPASQRLPSTPTAASTPGEAQGHKRSSTLSNIFSKSGSFFGGGNKSQNRASTDVAKSEKKYPPTSMKSPIATDTPRQSTDSRRPSFGFGRKNSNLSKSDKSRRFSLLPASFSFKNSMGGQKEQNHTYQDQKTAIPTQSSSHALGRESYESHRYDGSGIAQRNTSAPILSQYDNATHVIPSQTTDRYASAQYPSSNSRALAPGNSYYTGDPGTPADSDFTINRVHLGSQPRYPPGFNEYDNEPQPRGSMQQPRTNRVLHKPNKKFTDAWETDQDPGHHSGTSGAAKRVMDFFRRRGKARGGDDR